MFTMRQLKLVRESKVGKLLPKSVRDGESDWEASGVLYRDRRLWVVFDNQSRVASVDATLQFSAENKLHGVEHKNMGFEGVAFNHVDEKVYLLVESVKKSKNEYYGEIVAGDRELLRMKGPKRLDFKLNSPNKGFEAIAYLRRGEDNLLLGLLEGNHGRDGRPGRDVGNGRLQLFRETEKKWKHERTIKLPASVRFIDYSGFSWRASSSIARGASEPTATVAVTSQESSLLWVADLNLKTWTWVSDGEVFEFPRSQSGKILYGNIEGVAWLTASRLALVSDRVKAEEQPDRMKAKDESIHIFDLPR